MAGSAVTQFYVGTILLDDIQYPVYGGTIGADPAREIPPVLGNYANFTWGEGEVTPVVDINFVVRDYHVSNLSVLGETFLNPFCGASSRSADAAYDTTEYTNPLSFWDGRDGWTLTGVKPDSFTFSVSRGGPVQLSARFCGAAITRITSPPDFGVWDNSNTLRFKAVTLGSGLSNKVWNLSLSYSNNHTPDGCLNGSLSPEQWNAGMPTAGLQLTVQAVDAEAVAGYLNTAGSGDPGLYGTGASIVVTGVVSTPKVCTFTIPDLLAMNPNSRNTAGPRVMRQLSFTCMPATGQALPLEVSSTFG